MDNVQNSRDPSNGESRSTAILDAADVERLLDLRSCMDAVEQAFLAHAGGRTFGPEVLGIHVPGGGFHIKAAGTAGPSAFFAAKLNANFPGNGARFGLPTIQGVVVLSDAGNGFPLAVMDSASVTVLRTAAATGLAARTLARHDARTATICGVGAQGRAQLRALALVRPLERAFAFDLDTARAREFSSEMGAELGIPVEAASSLAQATRRSDMIVTCTPSRQAYLTPDMVRPGTFVAAVGADSDDKQEIAPALMASAKVVVDALAQCVKIGDLHHAIAAGAMAASDVHAELSDILAGRSTGRENPDEVTVFDSTGTALQDVAAAAAVFRQCSAGNVGLRVRFAGR